uniref:AB hydrolase-1 domain-containing protein n=1 Tax=Fagus sylvatica TaxID=28930 RepID=A0A2N9EXU4_FAGSY
MMKKVAGPQHCPLVYNELHHKTICGNNQQKQALIQELIKKMRQESKRPRGLPWPPKPASTKGNDHRSPALRWSLLILIMELRKHGLEFQVLALARKYKVYVPDLLFFGRSITDRSERSPEFQAECVAKGLRKLGVERCTLVGFSYGGMVGFKMAEMYPDLVESMVFTGCVMALTKSISDAALKRIGLKSWSEFLLPDSVQGVKLLLTRATYKLP